MKNKKFLLALLVLLAGISTFGQQKPEPFKPSPRAPKTEATGEDLPPQSNLSSPDATMQNEFRRRYGLPEESTLTKFKLDFPGGAPQQLVGALEKAVGKPLNVIFPADCPAITIPPLKLNNVDISDVFNAVSQVGRSGPFPFLFQADGKRSDDAVWTFQAGKPHQPEPVARVCRFYSLAPYLERGLTADDIITAIDTGWAMLGGKENPTFKFHKETKLLIVVGEPSKLETIDAVLHALPPATPIIDPTTGIPIPATPRTETTKPKK